MITRNAARSPLVWLGAGALALSMAAAIWYVGPWSDEFRLARADLLALDARANSSPDDALAWYYLGVRLYEKGAPREAAAALRRALQLRPRDVRVMVALGQALLDTNRVDDAFQILKTAEASAPRSTDVKRLLGRLYQRRGAYHRAEQQWRGLLALQPGDVDAWYALGFCHLQMQQVEQATTAAEQALKRNPRDKRALRLRASIAAANGDLAAARRYFEYAVSLYPEDARVHHDLANFLLTQSRSPEDLRRAEKAVAELARLQPDYPLLSWHRARLAMYRKTWREAVAQLQESLRVEPGLDEAYFHLASAYYRLGERAAGDQATRTYRRRSELTRRIDELRIRITLSDNADLHFELSRLRREAGLFQQAREAVQEGLRLAPNAPRGLAELRKLDAVSARTTAP